MLQDAPRSPPFKPRAQRRPIVAPSRTDFPLLAQPSLVYLDSAATTLKPRCVIDAVRTFYESDAGPVSRAAHVLSERATARYESAREEAARFFGLAGDRLVLTRNATDSVQIVADGLELAADDEVIVSVLEHHSNLLPWRRVAKVVTVGIEPSGTVDLDALSRAIGARTRLIALSAASNVSGVLQPIADIVRVAARREVPVLLDAAQLAGHAPLDFDHTGADFFVASAHKMLGPSGVGLLGMSARGAELLREPRPGGGAVELVTAHGYVPRQGPARFEPGSPNVEGAVGMAAALAYLDTLGLASVHQHGRQLADEARARLQELDCVDFPFAAGDDNVGIVTFVPRSDIELALMSQVLSDTYGIAVRHGHHCAQPLYAHLDAPPALRASFYVYNDRDDVDRLVQAIEELRPLLCSSTRRSAR
jgi:cysteine desulfurase/selenocysteine lyase